MSSRWFYILFANIAVLTVNIWLYVHKPESDPISKSTHVLPSLLITDKLNEKLNSSANDKGISSIEGFYFMLNDPLASQEQDLQADLKFELSNTQIKISDQNKAIKQARQKSVQQAKQIILLEKLNNKLNRELFMLGAELARSEKRRVKNKQTIALFELEKQEQTTPLKIENQWMKESIDAKQDLVVLTPSKNELTDSTIMEKGSRELEDPNFSGSMEFGFKYEQDNQVTRAIKGRLVLDYDEPEKYNFNSDLDFEFESEDEQTSTEKYRWQLQSNYNLAPLNTAFARSDISRSKFASYKQEDIFTVGYGRIFFNTYSHKFNMEVGPGYRSAVPNAGKDAVSIDEFIVRTRLNYERIVTENLQVKVNATLEAGHSNSVYNFNFKAQNRIYQELYLVFDFAYKYTQNVPVETVNKEVASGLSILYAF